MHTLLPFVAITAVALIIVLWAERVDRPMFNLIFKPIASLGFVAAAVVVGALESELGIVLFVSLVFAMAGDILLIFKASRRAFLAGIGSFLLSHVGYIVVFALLGIHALALAVALGVFALIAWHIAAWLRPHTTGVMRVAVPAYIAVITLMVAFSVGTTVLHGEALPVMAATTFWLSDLTVARQRFVKAEFTNRLVGLPLYYLAQYLFVALLF
jgi:uncharacterized membrane protein YhhN